MKVCLFQQRYDKVKIPEKNAKIVKRTFCSRVKPVVIINAKSIFFLRLKLHISLVHVKKKRGRIILLCYKTNEKSFKVKQMIRKINA